MPLEIQPCTPPDYPSIILTQNAAFKSNPATPYLFPGPFPQSTIDGRAALLGRTVAKDSSITWLKVVDIDVPFTAEEKAKGEEYREGIAFAKWMVYIDKPCGLRPIPEIEEGKGMNVPACKLVFGKMREQRSRILGDDRNCVYLHTLATHPDHQRRGAGSMLLRWGVEIAEKHGLPTYLEASIMGRELYKKNGFRDLDLLEVDLSEWGAKEPWTGYAMVANADKL